ncbi:DNA-directed RNA polymerase III subunit RPC4 [Nymphon striatum]|nr:DNA-directed RNA polymerase III subunit RPC4 [Nymphon striatum]
MYLPPDDDSMHHHLVRVNYVTYCQNHYELRTHPCPFGNGWALINGKCRPVRHSRPVLHSQENTDSDDSDSTGDTDSDTEEDTEYDESSESDLPYSSEVIDMPNITIFYDCNPYIFLKLPPALPTIPVSDNYVNQENLPSTLAKQPNQTKEEKKEDSQQSATTLANLPEGLVGKIEITKSGKARLKLGSMNFAVEIGVQTKFLEDLVSIKVPEEGTGDMTVLGHVKPHLICSAEIEQLL